MMTVDDLLRAARNGDERAWQELSTRLSRELNGYFRAGHQDADARDLANCTLLIVLAKIDGFELREGQSLLHWVFGIARRENMSARRQRGRDGRLADHHAAHHATPAQATGPATKLERKRQRERAMWVMQQLETPYREAIQNDIDGGTAQMLAERRGITVNNAYVLRCRARKKFHALLEHSEPAARQSTPAPS
jgi:DNA-directed RNA polymerase specialized sigma24 family protein